MGYHASVKPNPKGGWDIDVEIEGGIVRATGAKDVLIAPLGVEPWAGCCRPEDSPEEGQKAEV